MINYVDYMSYNIEQYSYPEDLQDSSYGGNMVVFYINVNKASKFLPPENQVYDLSKLENPMRSEILARDVSVLNATASGVIGNALPAMVAGNLAGVNGLVKAGSVLAGASLFAAGEIAGTTTREMRRLKTAIALHMPNSLNIRYSVGWESEDMAGAEMVSRVGEDGLALIKSALDVKPSNQLEKDISLNKVGKNIAGMVANLGLSNAPGGNYMSARTGLAGNPKKELVFKGVDFRTFSFTYTFFARSENEAKKIQDIIYQFKYHMHPEFMDDDHFLYLYPSEFDITYYSSEGENTHLHKHTSCVLMEMNVDYAPNGNFNSFWNGMPTQINVSLTFKELMQPTKESIKRGL